MKHLIKQLSTNSQINKSTFYFLDALTLWISRHILLYETSQVIINKAMKISQHLGNKPMPNITNNKKHKTFIQILHFQAKISV